MPELLRSAKLAVEKGQSQGRNETYIKQLSDYIVPALVEALHKVIVVCFIYFLVFLCQYPAYLFTCLFYFEDFVLFVLTCFGLQLIFRNLRQKFVRACWML
ncbi:hypothetical protein CsSME_00039650 [Camellia sinensis var. sinensis]